MQLQKWKKTKTDTFLKRTERWQVSIWKDACHQLLRKPGSRREAAAAVGTGHSQRCSRRPRWGRGHGPPCRRGHGCPRSSGHSANTAPVTQQLLSWVCVPEKGKLCLHKIMHVMSHGRANSSDLQTSATGERRMRPSYARTSGCYSAPGGSEQGEAQPRGRVSGPLRPVRKPVGDSFHPVFPRSPTAGIGSW